MYIREGNALGGDKELKVRIPVEQHLRLHSLKVLTGKPISEAVSEALSAYFEHYEGPGRIHSMPVDVVNAVRDRAAGPRL